MNRPGTIVDQRVLVDDLAFAANLINASSRKRVAASSILSESIISGKFDARQFPQARKLCSFEPLTEYSATK